MKIEILSQMLSICKLKDLSEVNGTDELFFMAKTDEEYSLVCSSSHVPDNILECQNGWRAFRIEGILDFSLIGIIAQISAILAEQEIGIFVVSTFNTDYILTKSEDFASAISVLKKNGYDCEDAAK